MVLKCLGLEKKVEVAARDRERNTTPAGFWSTTIHSRPSLASSRVFISFIYLIIIPIPRFSTSHIPVEGVSGFEER